MAQYAIGVDFGTLSGRAVLVETATGEELASAVYDYPHGVMDQCLPDGTALPPEWALQHPSDYFGVLSETIPAVLEKAGVSAGEVVGVGIDFTACTVLPVKSDGTPLCFLPQYQHNPHAYVKLWKHHAAQDKADRLNAAAAERGEKWLARYGGKVSSEWLFPKLWQILNEAPALYADMDYFIEAADWVVWQLTGTLTRSSCTAGYKALWSKQDGYPDSSFFKALDPRLERVVEEKLFGPVLPLGAKAGEITALSASLTGLLPGTAVAVANVDAHVCVPAVKISGPGKMLAIMGTSTCHMLLSEKETPVPGICGAVLDGILPNFCGYEAGQSCVGDHFAWLIDRLLPADYRAEAERRGLNPHQLLREKAERLAPGESGLLALDWWNGNRSVLADVSLSGLLLGVTLATKAEEIYRALIEATAYGTRKIIENFRQSGVAVEEFYAAGGIPQKDPMAMQIYADVINMPVRIAGSAQGPALGAAIFGAAAAGREGGGYGSVSEAAAAMGKLKDTVYLPDKDHAAVYDILYTEYDRLHDYFGRGGNDVMKRLKALRRDVKGGNLPC
ncbi:MAG: ribulokinase [Oscillospiraceae bacterium]|jgi:L-ribulokinase|nr:ribulokinase [Oscillospiraceae bacterium]